MNKITQKLNKIIQRAILGTITTNNTHKTEMQHARANSRVFGKSRLLDYNRCNQNQETSGSNRKVAISLAEGPKLVSRFKMTFGP